MSAFELTKHLQSLKLLRPHRFRGDAFTRKYIISLLILTLGQGQARNVAQFPQHHMTYARAKFEAVMPNGFGVNLQEKFDMFKVT